MDLTESEVIAGLTVLANSIGLKSDETINIAVTGGSDSFSAQYGANGIQSFEYGNSSAKIVSQDVVIMNAIKFFLIGSAFMILMNLLFRNHSK